MQYDSLTEAVRLLGCFSDAVDIQPLFDTNIQENDTIVQEQSLDAEVDINRVVWEEFFWKSPENQWDYIKYFYFNQQLLLSFITTCRLLPFTCNKIRQCSFSVHVFVYAIFYNCLEGVGHTDVVRLKITLWIMFTIVIVFTTCRFDEKLPLVLQSAAILIKFLYNMVLDTFDRYKYMFIVVFFYEKNPELSCENC